MKTFFFIPVAFVGMLLLASCAKSDDPAPTPVTKTCLFLSIANFPPTLFVYIEFIPYLCNKVPINDKPKIWRSHFIIVYLRSE